MFRNRNLFRALSFLWCVQIFLASGETLASDRTRGWLFRIAHLFGPFLSDSLLAAAHLLLRKGAHAVEYGILAFLVYHAWAKPKDPSRSSLAPALGTILFCAAYALTDEFHQWFVAGRGASPLDWMIDLLGATAVTLICSKSNSRRDLSVHP